MVRYTRRINAYTVLQGKLKPHKRAGRTQMNLNSTADELKAELKKVERDVKFSNIGDSMTHRKARIDVGDTPDAAQVKFQMENKDLLRFADEMQTEHVMEERKKNKTFHKDDDVVGNHEDIHMKALKDRDWIRWLESGGVVVDHKLLINRNPIGSNTRFTGENVGDITPENFIKHFGDKTLKKLHDTFDEVGGGMKFTFSIQLIMHSINGDDVHLQNLFIRASAPVAVINHSEIEEEFKKQYQNSIRRC
jgi:hypothetical protein